MNIGDISLARTYGQRTGFGEGGTSDNAKDRRMALTARALKLTVADERQRWPEHDKEEVDSPHDHLGHRLHVSLGGDMAASTPALSRNRPN